MLLTFKNQNKIFLICHSVSLLLGPFELESMKLLISRSEIRMTATNFSPICTNISFVPWHGLQDFDIQTSDFFNNAILEQLTKATSLSKAYRERSEIF